MREYYAAMSGLGKVKELAGRPGVNPQDLDDTGGEEEETELSYALKELFWDKIVVFLTTAIIGLSAVDILTELLRGGSGIVCFVPDELNLTEGQEDYVNSYCAQSVPDTQYLPIFVLVQGVLVATWHYLWKSSFTSHFDYFFSLAKTLTRLSDETTGEYPRKNLNIIKKLEIEFSTFSPSKILRWYQAKLGAQLITAIVSMLFLFLVFTNFDVDFNCPRIENQYWPIPGEKINCIFTSLRLFSLVRVADAFLLVLVILAVLWGFIWSISRHTTELGCTNVALFSYTTGISPEYFLPKPMFSHIRGFFANICSARIGQEIVLRFFSPRIKTDLDFLLMMLYRTDSGLGHSFKEGQIYTSYKRLSDADLLRLNIHIRTKRNNSTEEDETEDHKLNRMEVERINLKWRFQCGVYTSFAPIKHGTTLQIPDVIRGAVLGYGLCAPSNERAIDISFGSQGFSFSLARAFKLVGSINFDPSYKDSENPIVQVQYPVNVTAYRCHEDILSQGAAALIQFAEQVDKLWSYGERSNVYKTGFAVVGPIDQRTHLGTAELLLQKLKTTFAEGAVLLVVRPIRIEGKATAKQFLKFVPSIKLFKPLQQDVRTINRSLPWPARQCEHACTNPSENAGTDTTQETRPLSERAQQDISTSRSGSASNDPRPIFRLECGNSQCEFELAAYKFIWQPPPPPPPEDESSSSESENEDESDESNDGSMATGEILNGENEDDKQLLLKKVPEDGELKPKMKNTDDTIKNVNEMHRGDSQNGYCAAGSAGSAQTSIRQSDLESLRNNQEQ